MIHAYLGWDNFLILIFLIWKKYFKNYCR